MKRNKIIIALSILLLFGINSFAQELQVEQTTPVKKIVKNTFESTLIIDNQTVMVPAKGTFEMDINHRFGTWEKGYKDFWGFFAPSNIRLAFSYVPIKNLFVGISITKSNMTWEGFAKYSILQQTKNNKIPVSVSWYSNVAVETRDKEFYKNSTDRVSFFHQLIIARKLTDKISVQVAPSVTHMNFAYGQFVEDTTVKNGRVQERKHNHFAIALSGRYKIKEGICLLVNYDQPITKHMANNPSPNFSFGLEMTTSSHAFQVFFGNYPYMTPQRNNYFNTNSYKDNQFLLGFNITRLWSY